jgi:transglutaminase-like putative cysteine protease
MDDIFWRLIGRLRPRIGWPQALLALVAVICPSFAAADSAITLPIGIFFWAGVVGLGAGMRGGRRVADERRRGVQGIARAVLWVLVVGIGLGAIFILAVGDALPPAGLLLQDAALRIGWGVAVLRQSPTAGAPPLSRSWIFLADALPRAWRSLLAAPSGGESGARLMLAASGVALTWAGSLTLGWGLNCHQRLLGWGLPLLVALTLTSVLGAGSGVVLVMGIGALLLLAITTDFRRRADGWERSRIDFSDELSRDVPIWGGAIIAGTLLVALLLPTWLDNPFALAVWHDVNTPSGLAVLERNIRLQQQRPAAADVSISKLPALQLGMSLEQAPPEEIALRVQVDTPLPTTPWPHYWRARLFNLYNGQEWSTNAHVRPLAPVAPASNAFPYAIVQTITDTRGDREIALGLADVIGISRPANAERLADGTLTALTGQQLSTQYRVLSRPQEFAAPPTNSEPPDLRGYLALPGNLPPRIRELARAITAGQTTTYDQALALESYLRALPYSYQVQPLPHGGDAVDQFLFDMRQGYCTYYASAMAVMARSLGIPARVASGYATGSYDPASKTYIVHEADAHAWPELYVNDRWLPFEPTPIRPLPGRTSIGAPQASAGAPAPGQAQPFISDPLLWLAALVLIGLLAAGGVWLGRRLRPVPLITQMQRDLERRGRQAAIAWPAGATIQEYGALLEPQLDDAGALHELIALIEQARYGGHALNDAEQRRLRAAGQQVWAKLRRK